MNKIILIKKYTDSCPFWPNLIRKKKIDDFSVKEILIKYDGFEGELIDSFSFTEDWSRLIRQQGVSLDDIFMCVISNGEEPFFIKDQFIPVGYDFGICEEDQTIYSSIFNEILFGNVQGLISYKNTLNDHFLFDTRSLAEKYAALHHQLLIEGKDLEDDSDMSIYKIWKYNR